MTSHIDRQKWPDQLAAHVVQDAADEPPRIHGYDVETDLARNYSFSTTLVLALTGELPDEPHAAALEMVLQFLAPIAAAEAPAHAAILARVSGARTTSVLAVGAVGLCEQARDLVARHAGTLAWLASGAAADPPACAGEGGGDSAERLRRALVTSGLDVPALAHPLGREAACLAVLYACGLERPEQLETALVVARLPCVAAEAFAWAPGRIREYPTNLPRFEPED